MRIPEIQTRLHELAVQLGCAELSTLANELSRRRSPRRAAVNSQPMTPELKDAIRAYHRAHPQAAQTDIARVFNVNPGRVSEALRGVRH